MIILDQLVHDTLDAITTLHRADRVTQALILLYSAIDTLGWLGTPEPRATGESFRNWVDLYLLPDSDLECNAEDLYSARCGLLHTHTAESTGTASGNARQIWYWTGEKSRSLLEYEAGGRTDVVFVRVIDLVAAFVEGAERFAEGFGQDATQAQIAEEKARRWIAWVPAPPAA
jgi:hypothetical protein